MEIKEMIKVSKIVFVGVLFISLAFSPIAFAARTVPGNIPELAPLQPIPENTKPNVSGNIERVGSEEVVQESNASLGNAPQALEELQENLPLPLPESSSSPWVWLVAMLALVATGGGIGYWAHIRNKR